MVFGTFPSALPTVPTACKTSGDYSVFHVPLGQGQPLPPGGYQPPPGQVGFQPHPGFVPPGGQPGYQPQGYQQPGYQPQGYQPQGYQPQGYQPQGYPPPGGYGQPIAAQPTSGGTPAVTGE